MMPSKEGDNQDEVGNSRSVKSMLMRITASVVLSAIGLASITLTPALAADPVGDWLTEGNNVIHIDHCGSALCGKIVELGPQASLQGRPLLGLTILSNMNPSVTSNKWEGLYYNFDSHITYRNSFSMRGTDTIDIEVCDGSRCEPRIWPRVTAPNQNNPSSPTTTLNKNPSSRTGVSLKTVGGTFVVPVQINGAITLDFTIDTGAADVSVPADVFSTLVRMGTIKDTDIIGEQTYVLADGSRSRSPTFTIRSLRVGDRVVENVRGSVASFKGSLLLGQSFLERFKSWSIDNTNHVLLLEPRASPIVSVHP